MTDPYPFPKQTIHAAPYNAPPLKFPYLIFSAPSSSGCFNIFFLISYSSVYSVGIGDKSAVARSFYWPSSNAEVENERIYASAPLIRPLGEDSKQFYLFFLTLTVCIRPFAWKTSFHNHVKLWKGPQIFRLFLIFLVKKKVKCTLVQALRFCTGRTAHRGSRGIAALYRHWGSVQAVRRIGGVEV